MNNKYLALVLLLVLGFTAFTPFVNATPTQITTKLFLSQAHYYQRHSWYSNGRFWVLYGQVDGVNEYVYQSSLDGVTWLAHTQIVTSQSECFTQRCDVALASDGTTIHVVMALKSSDIPYTHYKKGTCNADGTITWAGAGSSITPSGTEHSIALDSQDYPTIVMNYNNELNLQSYRSTTKNGLFTIGAEDAEQINSGTDIEGEALSIGGQNLYVVYTKASGGGKLYGKTFSFATKTWGAEDTITTTDANAYNFSLVSDGSIVYLAWREQATGRAYGAIRSAAGVWTELGDLGGEAVTGTPSITLDSNFGGAWVLWANAATNIKIRHIDTDGTLSTAKTIKSKGVAVVETGLLGLEVMEVTNDLNHLGIVYPTATGTSFDLLSIYSDFYITNMEGSDAYGDGLKLIAVEEKFYNFQLDVTGIIADPVTYASIRFYNNGNLIQVDYNATTALTTVVAGNDYIMLHETLTSTSGDTISIIWSIWLKSTCLDKEDLDIQTYFSLESGANIGWDTYPSYCDLGNLYGWVSTSVSGAQSSTTTCSTAITTSVTLSSTTYLTTSLTTPSTSITTTSVTTTTTTTRSTSTRTTVSGTTVTTTTTTVTPAGDTSSITIITITTSSSTTCTSTTSCSSSTRNTQTTTVTSRTTSTTVYSTTTTSSTVITTSASTILKYVGAAGVSPGGDIFDLYTYPNSMAKGQVAFRNLQNVHVLFNHHVNYQRAWDLNEASVIPIEIGIDYWTGTEYVTGWSVKIELTDAFISDKQQYLTWTISWYFNGDLIGTPTKINTLPIVNDVDSLLPLKLYPASTSFIVDLWYNKMNSSSVVGGRITAEYYAMKDVASPWLGWWTGSDWTPLLTDSNQVMFFHNLENGSDTIISARDIEMSYFWVKMTQDNNAYNTKYSLKDWDVMDFGVTEGDMIGINTPSFVATKVHSMAQTGFLNSLWASLQQTFDGLLASFGGTVGWLGDATFNFVDSILAYFGLSGAFRTFTGFITDLWTNLLSMTVSFVEMTVDMLEMVFALVGYIVYGFTSFVSIILQFINIIKGIADGTGSVTTGLGNIWITLNLAVAFPLITILGLLYWIQHVVDDAGGSFATAVRTAHEELQIFFGITIGVLSYVYSVLSDIVLRIIEFIRSMMPVV